MSVSQILDSCSGENYAYGISSKVLDLISEIDQVLLILLQSNSRRILLVIMPELSKRIRSATDTLGSDARFAYADGHVDVVIPNILLHVIRDVIPTAITDEGGGRSAAPAYVETGGWINERSQQTITPTAVDSGRRVAGEEESWRFIASIDYTARQSCGQLSRYK